MNAVYFNKIQEKPEGERAPYVAAPGTSTARTSTREARERARRRRGGARQGACGEPARRFALYAEGQRAAWVERKRGVVPV